ncbi:hypothetical protein KUTeg_022491 [Tegillarca granosa]|uniref:Uncharacterized protein n=1 Tax=Tegillarca granosa TaxID=220873 RepID=A0ABQ9EBM9_TEGGR|nr:hypothetical protein KUTeg_022491 [Tegillarca granosa]
MASMTLRGLKTTGRLKPIFSLRSLSTTRVVNGSKPWYYLYEPDSYPESEKEVEVAAKKYGMVPFDYKPFPRDLSEENFGDYPDIPIIFKSQRLHENYDMPALKRNYGEPMPKQYPFEQSV